jgi:hypothetical protein
MQYPHWLIVAGAFLVAVGFIGLALSRNRNLEPTEDNPKRRKSDFRQAAWAALLA